MGPGSLSTFGLAEARTKAAECRKLTYEGIDPIEVRRAERAKVALDTAGLESGHLKLVVDGVGDIPLKLAQGTEDIPMLRAGGALSLFASQQAA